MSEDVCCRRNAKENIAAIFPKLFMHDYCSRVRMAAVMSVFARTIVHEELSHDKSWRVREKVAIYCRNPRILANLATDPHYGVRAAVADNEYTDAETLDKLAKDTSFYVLERVVANKNTKADTLDYFMEIKDWLFDFKTPDAKLVERPEKTEFCENMAWSFAFALASNPSVKIETFEELVQYDDYHVRFELFYNEKMNYEICKKLTRDENKEVREFAKKMLSRFKR